MSQSQDVATQAKNEADQQSQKFAVVTGASSGIGFELAKIFARENYRLLICSESDAIKDAASQLRQSNKTVQVEVVQANLASPEGVEKLYQAIQSSGAPIDAIAINAGVGVGGDFARDTDLTEELNLIDLNVRSTVHLTKLVLQDMVKANRGKILFTSSIAAMMPGAFEAVYNASKAFIQSFSQAIREELKSTEITVTALQPGATETNFFHRAHMDNTKVGQSEKDDAAGVAQEGFDALMAGKDHVVAGSVKNNVFSTMGKILPETVGAKAHREMSQPLDEKH